MRYVTRGMNLYKFLELKNIHRLLLLQDQNRTSSEILTTVVTTQLAATQLPVVRMDLTMLLMTTSIFAGVHMMLFVFASTLALIYYRRYKKLQRQIAHDAEAYRGEDEHAGREVSTEGTAATTRARMERRQRRRREEFRRQASEGASNFSDVAHRVNDREMMALRPTTTRESKGDANEKQLHEEVKDETAHA